MSGLWSFRPASSDFEQSTQVVRDALPLAFVGLENTDRANSWRLESNSSAAEVSVSDDAGELALDYTDDSELHRDWLKDMESQVLAESSSAHTIELELFSLHRHGGGQVAAALAVSGSCRGVQEEEPVAASDSNMDPLVTRLLETLHSTVDELTTGRSHRSVLKKSATSVNQTASISGLKGKPPLGSRKPPEVQQSTQSDPTRTLSSHRESLRSQSKAAAAAAEAEHRSFRRQTQEELKALRGKICSAQSATEAEVDKRKCLEAITNIQRLRSVAASASNTLKRPLPTMSASSTLVEAKGQRDDRSFQSSNEVSSLSLRSTKQQGALAAVSSAESDISRIRTPSAGNRLRHSDPWQRLYQGVEKRNVEIQNIQQGATKIVLDPRRARQERLAAFAAKPKKDELVAAALELRVRKANDLRLLFFYGWQPWRKHILLTKFAMQSAGSRHRCVTVAHSFSAWRVFVANQKKVTVACRAARLVSLSRLLVHCWKRRTFLLWRSVVMLRKADQRTADRKRKGKLFIMWARRLSAHFERQERHRLDLAEQAFAAYLRRVKSTCLRHWFGRCDARQLQQERESFRRAMRSVLGDSSKDNLLVTSHIDAPTYSSLDWSSTAFGDVNRIEARLSFPTDEK